MRSAWWLVMAMVLLSGCGPEQLPATKTTNGQALAAIACARCHTLPAPSHLSRDEWPYLLAWMGNYLGHPPGIEINPLLVDQSLVPPRPLVTRAEFDAICSYFVERAAVEYKLPTPAPKPAVSRLFEPLPFAIPASVISMVAIDSSDQSLVIGTSQSPGLLVLQRGVTKSVEVHSEPATYERIGPIRRVALIGHLGLDAQQGRVVDFDMREGTQQLIVDAHPRIAAHSTADVDGDGQSDLLVCGFGDYSLGRVGIWWGGAEKPQEQVLFAESGASWCDIADLDGDGDRDIVLAVANARPRVVAFVNEGGRRFVSRAILERAVGWGYNRCLLVDWDGDGDHDLVELAGNNLELRGRPIKAGHGVRVLRNDRAWRFVEIIFERLAGALDVAAGDFDGNGRIDLAVTAFYPDWRSEFPTTLLLLMQLADGTVERAGLDDRSWNRWMRIASGDADGDGDTDLLLGAAPVPIAIPPEHAARYRQLLQDKASVLLLRNISK